MMVWLAKLVARSGVPYFMAGSGVPYKNPKFLPVCSKNFWYLAIFGIILGNKTKLWPEDKVKCVCAVIYFSLRIIPRCRKKS